MAIFYCHGLTLKTAAYTAQKVSSAATSNDGEIETVVPHKEEEIEFFVYDKANFLFG